MESSLLMKKLSDFNLNKEEDSYKNCLNLRTFIDEIVENDLELIIEKQSNILDLPKEVISRKLKKIIFNKFNFESGKFHISNKLLNIFKGYLINIFLIFYIFIFRKKVKNFEERDITLDGVDSEDELNRFKPLFSKFDKSFFIKNKNFKFFAKTIPNSKSISFYGKPINPMLLKDKIFYYLKFLNFLIGLSVKKKFNYFDLTNIILFAVLRSESIFYNYKSKFKINDRFYYTCPVKNYIFKKHGGKLNVCTQIHLVEASISFYTDTDVLFTLGNEKSSKKKLLDLGGKIENTFPIGSLKMEHLLLTNNKLINDEHYKSDVLIVGINVHRWIHTSNLIKKNYYNFIEWMGLASKKFPNLKFVYKHHSNNKKDMREEKILNGSRINIISEKKVSSSFDHYGSYYYLKNSKIVFSFASTMILEARCLNKEAYFVDPKFQNSGYFGQLEYLKNIRIDSFESIEKIISRKNNFNEIVNNTFCISSKDTTEKIFNFLQKF